MNRNFKQLKSKCLTAVIIKSVVTGLSAGLCAVGIILLSLALNNIFIHWGYYILIGIAVAVIFGGLFFLLMRPTDMKVAKKYDNEFRLKEKLQTMVAFEGKEGEIIALQREDAAETLAKLPVKTFQLSKVWQYFVIGALALCMFFSGVFIPTAAQAGSNDPSNGGELPPDEEVPEEDDSFEYDLYMQSAIGELVMNVRESNLAADQRNAIVTIIEALDSLLTGVDTKTQMRTAVISAVTLIDGVIYEANSFRKVSREIADLDENLSVSLCESVAVYNSSSTLLNDFLRVKAFETRIGDLIDIVLGERLPLASADLKVSQSGVEDEETGELITLGDVLPAYIDGLNTALENIDDKDDRICTALDTFRITLKLTSTKLGKGYSDETLFKEIDSAFDALSPELNIALSSQCYNCVMNLFVRLRLASIFDVDMADLPAFNEDLVFGNSDDNGDDDEDDDDDSSGGGGGNGNYDFVFGSDDIIYDPDSADYVSYGKVLDEYYKIMQNRVIAGEVPDELAKILQSYFEILYNGLKDGSVDD